MKARYQKTRYDMGAEGLLLQQQDARKHAAHFAEESARSIRRTFSFLSLLQIYLWCYLRTTLVLWFRYGRGLRRSTNRLP